MTERGKYIVIEGTDGTGKSTQVERVVERLAADCIRAVQFHEPDGVEISSHIREVLVNGDLARSALTNVLLYSAARRENWLQQGKAALDMGDWIISSRDYTSTLAYQGYAEGVDLELIEHITRLSTDEQYMTPDHRIILTMDDAGERERRIAARGVLEKLDTFERRDASFQQKIVDGYLDIARYKQIPLISAAQPVDTITDQIWQIIRPEET